MKNIDYEISKFLKTLNESNEKIFISNETDNEIIKKIDTLNTIIKNDRVREVEKYDGIIENLKLKRRIQRTRERSIITGLINILDSIDWLMNGSMIFTNNALEKSINSAKKLIGRELENMKIIRTPHIGDLYNENYHVCIGYRKDDNLLNNQILQVIKSGYIFRDKIIRQAEVIVVNNDIEEGDNDEHNRN